MGRARRCRWRSSGYSFTAQLEVRARRGKKEGIEAVNHTHRHHFGLSGSKYRTGHQRAANGPTYCRKEALPSKAKYIVIVRQKGGRNDDVPDVETCVEMGQNTQHGQPWPDERSYSRLTHG